MATGKLKIKNNRKVELKVNGKDMSVPKEYDFSDIEIGSHECEVNLDNGKIVEIIVNGKAIPKKDSEVQRKAQEAQKREQETAAQKERDKQEREQQSKHTDKNTQNQGNMSLPDSFNRPKMRVPQDVRNLTALTSIDNFALKLYKGARYETSDSKFHFFNPKPKTKKENGINITLVDAFGIRHNNYGLGDIIGEIAEQHKNSAELLFNSDGCLEIKNFKPDWRVIVGLGTDSVYETGITLHHIYGFPYIPASAIKGITNHYAQDKGYDIEQSGTKHKQWYDDIFGNTKQQGKITFFDAMPLTPPKLKPDIMNVHYPKYYGEGQAPTDTQNPVPILFLTVEETKFQFMLGCKEENKNLLKTAIDWLKNALEQKGIGAKTAVGYGYMQ